MFNTIVWAVDGSPQDFPSLPYVTNLAKQNGSAVIALHSVEHLAADRADIPLHADEEDLTSNVKNQVAKLVEQGIAARMEIVEGPTLVATPT